MAGESVNGSYGNTPHPLGKGPVALAEWSRVVEVVDDLMEATEHYPARNRVRRYPDRAALDAIGLARL
jgi:hypothetical protein